jgi:hypothetical protein
MKDKTSASLEALTGLLSERQRYEEWLSALESRKASTPDSVYQKVRADYQARLKEVSDRLGARAGELKSNIDSLAGKLEQISTEETAQHDVRQEAEVRAAVGEYTPDEWERLKQESEKELTRIARDRTATETQLAELNRVFSMSTNPGVVGSIAPAPQIVQTPAAPEAPSGPPKLTLSSEPNAMKRSSSSGWPQRDGDASSVISVSPGPALDRVTPSKPIQAGPFNEFAGLTQKTGTDDRETVKPEQPKVATVTPTKAKRGGLPDLRTEQQKTLKCPECGAMNYPTEWYCERCGGELATL